MFSQVLVNNFIKLYYIFLFILSHAALLFFTVKTPNYRSQVAIATIHPKTFGGNFSL
jgi:hypothetical protein